MNGEKLKAKIVIATHKKYRMPSDDIYLPLHVGAEGKTDAEGNELDFGYEKDNSRENISQLNSSFCELTGLYWAWKNLDYEYVGLVHYRRHFSMTRKSNEPFENVLTYEELAPLLKKYKVFVPSKRKYYIESLYSHYKHTHYSEQLDKTREIISIKYPDYLASYDRIVKQSYGYMFNMMIMRKDYFDNYCSWLFDINFKLNQELEMPELSFFQGRFYGRVSEIIFNVWLDYQITIGTIKKNEIKEIPCIHMEKVNWWKKGTAFLMAKFLNKRYEGSF
ncbi:DUF4422 domain-containing protein [Clostridium diolis]|uniref:Glycosyl transferase n=1 Tax=Clostridium diolis TaxID=223919 RepID=A0AAV3VUX6_9CLOT|nr:DUF4422 domain-containing protein [Clostridium diolis]QES72329.1 DUF4422 domain-containing protein [Clostridium diolis]GEA30043.1 glycosyl transferase [Clostridium diolis]